MSNRADVTLYDDWTARRDRLLLPHVRARLPAAEPHAKVLGYFLNRYAGSAAATRPAMFPLANGVEFNHRAFVINHHLGANLVAGIKNMEEAEARISAVLVRMQSTVDEGESPPWPGVSTLESKAMRRRRLAIDRLRLKLASDCEEDRMQALRGLTLWGSLDDVSLLSALAGLPPEANLGHVERNHMLNVMRFIGARLRP